MNLVKLGSSQPAHHSDFNIKLFQWLTSKDWSASKEHAGTGTGMKSPVLGALTALLRTEQFMSSAVSERLGIIPYSSQCVAVMKSAGVISEVQ